jgi:uncharacterized protein with PIN domain/sulfur carrier protein ThiS
MTTAEFRFYAELNDFIAPPFRHRTFAHACSQDATVKHMIEALGVPHTEVAKVLVNGEPGDLAQRLRDGDRISVYPHFRAPAFAACANAGDTTPASSAPASFIADAHLGQLARQLRMLGFDVLFRNSYSDAEVATIAREQMRVVLTRDRDLLIRRDVVLGCYVHAIDGDEQLCEVMQRYRLVPHVQPFCRCLECNGLLQAVEKASVAESVPPSSLAHYEKFFQCASCGHVYWEGSHVDKMRRRIARILQYCSDGNTGRRD